MRANASAGRSARALRSSSLTIQVSSPCSARTIGLANAMVTPSSALAARAAFDWFWSTFSVSELLVRLVIVIVEAEEVLPERGEGNTSQAGGKRAGPCACGGLAEAECCGAGSSFPAPRQRGAFTRARRRATRPIRTAPPRSTLVNNNMN